MLVKDRAGQFDSKCFVEGICESADESKDRAGQFDRKCFVKDNCESADESKDSNYYGT